MKNKKILIGLAVVLAIGIGAYFIFRKPKAGETGVTAEAKKNRDIKIV
jgi:uncharacterized protein YxeA